AVPIAAENAASMWTKTSGSPCARTQAASCSPIAYASQAETTANSTSGSSRSATVRATASRESAARHGTPVSWTRRARKAAHTFRVETIRSPASALIPAERSPIILRSARTYASMRSRATAVWCRSSSVAAMGSSCPVPRLISPGCAPRLRQRRFEVGAQRHPRLGPVELHPEDLVQLHHVAFEAEHAPGHVEPPHSGRALPHFPHRGIPVAVQVGQPVPQGPCVVLPQLLLVADFEPGVVHRRLQPAGP